MSHSVAPQAAEEFVAPDLPKELFESLEKVRGAPTDLEAWEELNERCREFDRPDEAEALYAEILNDGVQGEALEDVGRLAADFCEEWFEDTAHVLSMLQVVLRLDPKQTWAFERLTVLLTVGARWEELLSAYDDALRVAEDDAARQALLTEAAKVARDFAGMADRASDYLKALLLLRLTDDQLAATLEKRLDEQSRNDDLIEIWTARLEVLSPDVAKRTRLQIARRHLDKKSDPERALRAVEGFLEAEGDELRACEVLEDIADREDAEVVVRREALTLLDRLHSAQERYPAVISATERALGLSRELEDRLSLLKRATELYCLVGQPDAALSHTARILELDSSDDDARALARSLAGQVGRMDRFVGALVTAANTTDSGERRVDLLIQAAETCRADLGDSTQATQLFKRIEADPSADDAGRLLACRELSSLLEAATEHEDLLRFLEKRADLEPEPEGRRAILGQAARLATDLAQKDRALGLWSLRLKDDPDDDEALTAKIELFTELERYQGLVDALATRALLGSDAGRKRADLVRAAEVHEQHLQDLKSAISCWRTVEERFDRTEESLDALVFLSGRANQYEQVAELLKEGILDTQDPVRKTAQLGQLGETQRLYLQDKQASLDSYQAALAVNAEYELARNGLRALMVDPTQAHRASEVLVDAFSRSGDEAAIVDLLEGRLAASPDVDFSARVLLDTASLREKAGDTPEALSDVCRAFSLLPSESTERELHRLAEHLGDFVSAVDAYTAALTGLEDEARVLSLFLARGRLQQIRLAQPDEATTSFYEALRRQPENREIAFLMMSSAQQSLRFQDGAWALIQYSRAVDELQDDVVEFFHGQVDRHGDWRSALSGLAEGLVRADDLSERVRHDLRQQLAVWYRDQLQDLESAELVLSRAVADFPQTDSLCMLAELQRRAPGRALVDTLVTLADVGGEDLAVLREAGEVAFANVRDWELSRQILERALVAAKKTFVEANSVESEEGFFASDVCAWATDHLVTLALADGEAERAVELLDQSANLPFLPSEQVARRFRAAEAAAAAAMDERAVDLSEGVLSVEPEHEGAIRLLSLLHEKAGRLEKLLELRRRELKLDRPQERRLFLRLDQARVLGQIGQPLESRIQVLRENLTDLPGHEPSVEAVSTLLEESGAYEELATLLETQAAAIVDAEAARAAELWTRAGRIADQELESEVRLVQDFKLSAAAHPSIEVLDRLALVDCAAKRYEGEVSWLSGRLELTPQVAESEAGPEDRRQVVVRLGLALINTSDHRAACQLLEHELGRDAGANAERALLASVYEQLERYQDLSDILCQGIAYAENDTVRIEQLRRAALVERRQLGNLEAAIPLLKHASGLDETDRGLKLLLADTLAQAEYHDEAAFLLEGLLEEFGRRRTKERATVHKQLARIAQATGNLEEALAQAESAANIERTDASILMLVGQLASEKGQLERAEQAYRTLALITSRRTADQREADDVGESAVLFELYRIAEQRGDADQARELLQSSLEVAAERPAEASQLAESLIATGQIDLLLNALSSRIEAGMDDPVAARFLVTRANILEKSERFEDALTERLRALRHTPESGRLIEASVRLAERCGKVPEFWAEVIALAEANESRPEVAGDLWYRSGEAAEVDLHDIARAVTCFERALATGHRPKRSFLALIRVLGDGAESERLKAALRTFVAHEDAPQSPEVFADALYRLAGLEFDEGSTEEGAAHLMEALEVIPQEERALALLRPVVEAGVASERVVILFLRVCRKAADADTLLFAFREAAKTETVEANVLSEAVGLARTQDDSEALRELLSRSIELAVDRDEESSVSHLIVERALLARSDEEFGLEATLLSRAMPYLEGDDRFELRLRLAACTTQELGMLEEGQKAYEELLGETPAEARVWRPLLSLYRKSGRADAVEDLIRAVAEHVTDESDLGALRMERIRLMIGQDRFEEAEEELRGVLDERPSMTEAASILVELLRNQERIDELRNLLEGLYRQARDDSNEELVASYGLELARLVAEQERQEAISVLTAGLDLTKKRKDVLSYLLSLYDDEDNQSERADVMEFLLALQSGEKAHQLCLELAQLREDLDDVYGLGRALELGVRAAPDAPGLLDRYVEHLRAQEEHALLADALFLRAASREGAEAALVYAEASTIYEEVLGDPAKAAEASALAFEAEPSNVAHLEKSVQQLVALGEIETALSRLAEVIEQGDETALADLLALRATIIKKELPGDREAMTLAARDLVRALSQLVPEEQVIAIQENRVEILSELRVLHQAEQDGDAERAVVRELSQLMVETGDTFGAIDVLASYVREHEQDAGICAELGQIAMEAGDTSAAVFAYDRLVAASEGEEHTKAVLLLAEAAIFAGEPLAARPALEESFAAQPDNALILDHLRDIYEQTGSYSELAALLAAQAQGIEEVTTRAALLLEVGDCYLRAGDAVRACEVLEDARGIAENPYAIAAKLAQVYLAQNEVDRARQILDESIAAHGKRRSPELALLQHGLARVEEACGDLDGMFSWLEAALMSDRSNGEVAQELAIRGQEEGRYDIAIKALQSLTLSKVEGPMSKAEAYHRQAQIAQAQGDGKKALLMARRAQAMDNTLPGINELVEALGG